MPKKPPLGPKGGRTTRTAGGMVRKVILLTPDLYESLRRASFDERRSESEIVRDALGAYLDRES